MSQIYSMSIRGLDVYHAVSCFFIYSILGWIVESIYMSYCNRKWTNRGFIKGPICPIYGSGALMIYLLLQPLSGNYVAIYFVGLVVATGFEYLIAQIMLRVFGEVWWDYNDKPFNYKGILCLESTIVWGFYCVCLFGFLHKFTMMFVDWYTSIIGLRVGQMIVSLLILYYLVSFFRAMERQKLRAMENEEVSQVRKAWRTILRL